MSRQWHRHIQRRAAAVSAPVMFHQLQPLVPAVHGGAGDSDLLIRFQRNEIRKRESVYGIVRQRAMGSLALALDEVRAGRIVGMILDAYNTQQICENLSNDATLKQTVDRAVETLQEHESKQG